MGSPLTKLASLFIAPAKQHAPISQPQQSVAVELPAADRASLAAAETAAEPEAIVVLSDERDADLAAAAVASAAVAGSASQAALVCIWQATARATLEPSGGDKERRRERGRSAVAQLARELAQVGIDADRRRHGATVRLATDAAAAADELTLACRAVGPVPLVLVLAGRRPAIFEAMIAAADTVVLAHRADVDRIMFELALDRLRGAGLAVATLELQSGLFVKRAANAGRVSTRLRDNAAGAVAAARSTAAVGRECDRV